MKLSDIFPWAFSDAENAPEDRDVNLSTKKFSSFNVASGEGIEGVGLKDGQNVRFALTTDAISVNPNQFRNDKGQFIGTPEELANLRNQRDVNEFFYNAINDIEAGDVNLDGYATEEWVTGQIDALDPYDDTAINDALAAEVAAREAGDQALQEQIDSIEVALPGEFAKPVDIGAQTLKITGSRPTGAAGEDGNMLCWKAQTGGPASPFNEIKFIVPDTSLIDLSVNQLWLKQGDIVQRWETAGGGWFTNGDVLHVSANVTEGDDLIDGQPVEMYYSDPTSAFLDVISREESKADDQALQAQIDGIETDLSGYLPLSGGEMEGSAQIKVNNIAPVNTTSIKYDGSPSGHPMSLMNRAMISDFIDDKTEDFASVEYVDNADRILDAEIQELALALNALLAQRDHGQWEYVGLLQDAIPRSPGQFALQGAFTSEENVMVLNNEDLKGTTHALGTVNVGDYVEVVDLENPDNYVLYVVTDDDWGSGTLLEVSVALRECSGEIKIGNKCEVRFFAINQEDISISDLDARYLKLTGGKLTGTLNAPRIEAQKLEGGEAMMLIEGKLANNNSAARLTFSNKTNANAYGSLTWHGQNGDGWFAFNKDLDMNSEGLHSVGRIRLTGEKVICEGNLNRILLDEKVVITKVSGNGAGFTVKGKTNAGNNGDLLYVYHNSTGLDAINYAGKQDAPANLANVGYVDDAIAAIQFPESKKSRISTQVRTMFSTQAAQGKASFIDGNGNRQVRPDDGLGIEYTIARDWSGYQGDKDWWRDDYEPLDTGYIQVIDPFTGKIKWAAGIGEVTRTGDTIRWMISGSIYTNYPDWNPNMDYFLNLNGCLREK